MGLFQRRVFSEDTPLYEVVDSATQVSTPLDGKTLLVVGLGNIGKKYDGTRHNIGFSIIDNFAQLNGFDDFKTKKDFNADLSDKILGSTKVILAKPNTLMNNSGQAVQAIQQFYKITNANTFVIHDELDIKFGQIRLRHGGGPAGHNGIKSLIEHCGEEFGRMRIGVGPKRPDEIDSADFVLGKFNKDESQLLKQLLQESNSILSEYCYGDGLFLEETRSFLV